MLFDKKILKINVTYKHKLTAKHGIKNTIMMFIHKFVETYLS